MRVDTGRTTEHSHRKAQTWRSPRTGALVQRKGTHRGQMDMGQGRTQRTNKDMHQNGLQVEPASSTPPLPFPAPADLLLVLTPGGVQRLDEGGGVANEHGVAGGTHDHAQHGQPDVRHALWRLPPVPDAQHVAHGLEEGVGVLLPPGVVL